MKKLQKRKMAQWKYPTSKERLLTPEQYASYKRAFEEARRDAERAAGAREQLLSRLDDEFDCKSLEEAQKLKRKLEKDVARLDAECDQLGAGLRDEYADRLGG